MRSSTTIILAFLLHSLKPIVAQQTLYRSMLHDGVTRQYIVYIPAVYSGSTPVPLLFNFHGYGWMANDWMNLGGDMRTIADTAGFILVYPQGTLLTGNTHWNVGSFTAGSTADDLGFAEAMMDTLAANYNIDPDRAYSCGYSNGGYFSFELACQMSDRIAAIGSVAGTMSTETYNACVPTHTTPVVTIHGTADGVVDYTGTYPVNSESMADVLSYWVNYNNTVATPVVTNLPDIDPSDGSTVEHNLYDNGDNCTSVEHYKVIGGGHDWPGTTGNMDIDAGVAIWSFVSKYDINGLIGCHAISIPIKVFLEGPYDSNTSMMFDGLRTSGLIPLSEPFTALGFTHFGEGGSETMDPSVLNITGADAIVDWVMIELRDKNNSTSILNTRSALLQRDGDVVDLDGINSLIMGVPAEDYFISVRHRNHLGVMTLNSMPLSSSSGSIDFSSSGVATFGSDARKNIASTMVLWSGNVVLDGQLKYTGLNNDRDPILIKIGGTVATNTVLGYFPEDLNLDGVVKYTGNNNDRDRILVNIGGTVPTNLRIEQLP